MGLLFTSQHKKLNFRFKAGTSRGVLNHKNIWLIKVINTDNPLVSGYGEASPLVGLSIDDLPTFDLILNKELAKLNNLNLPSNTKEALRLASKVSQKLPSIRFGVETALLDLMNGGVKKLFTNAFYDEGEEIKINGLVWMGDSDLMRKRLSEKIELGFDCIKLKIGAININQELQLIKSARSKYDGGELEIRVDANGAFSFKEAEKILSELATLQVHSMEQPIKAGQLKQMADLCKKSPTPIALDEELIGVYSYEEKNQLLLTIKPQYIILKPTLLGGFASCLEWIEIAEANQIGWWLTSALESNIGLNAICQFASYLKVKMPQGLGTGGLYFDNIDSPLEVKNANIRYNKSRKWGEVMEN